MLVVMTTTPAMDQIEIPMNRSGLEADVRDVGHGGQKLVSVPENCSTKRNVVSLLQLLGLMREQTDVAVHESSVERFLVNDGYSLRKG